MTKKELIATISERTGTSKASVELVLDALAAVTCDVIGRGAEITLPGIVKLDVQAKAEREYRNPQTGAVMVVAAGKRVRFKALKALKDSLPG